MIARDDTWWVSPTQLDDDQQQVIKIAADSNALVLGPPGSGKTNLLLLRAAYLRRKGLVDIEVLVFTKALRRFMREGVQSGQYADLPTSKIKTYHAWAKEFIQQNDGEMPPTPSAGDRDGFYKYRLALLNAASSVVSEGGYKGRCDAILVDECQDYLPAELELLASVSKRLFIVGDNKQKIYAGDSSIATAERLVGTGSVHRLKFHYRTGLRICEAADEIMHGKPDYTSMAVGCNYNEGRFASKVERVPVTPTSLLPELVRRLRLQRAVYSGESIGVITPRRQEFRSICEYLEAQELGEYKNLDDTVASYGGSIIVSTAHSAKGLEFRAVHLVHPNLISRFPHQKGLAFTALTRAKTAVTVYDAGDLPGFLERSLQVPSPRSEDDDISNLFGGSRGQG